ncbi:MAG: FHA domain-containing protein [Gemmatimonadales bacterium]
MYAGFRYLDGPRAGAERVAGTDFATIGRHPASDVPFDPERDLEVSVRHAAVFRQGAGFMVRDLGSTNGTFLNGKRVRGDRPLAAGDQLQFGPNGPRLEFSLAADLGLPPRVDTPAPTPAAAPVRPEIFGPRTRTTERIRVEVARRTRPWKWIAAAAVVLAAGAVGGAVWQTRRTAARLEQQRTALLGRVDELLFRLRRARGAAAGISAALDSARQDVATLRGAIANERLSAARLDTLARALADRSERHEVVLAAADLDPATATEPNRPAVAVLVSEFRSGAVESGTAFAVRANHDTVVLATARHLLIDSTGAAAVRTAVIFEGTGQAFLARTIRLADSADAALVTTTVRGGAPVVKGLEGRAAAGEAVAMMGYPFGLDSLGDWRRDGARATGSTGTITGVSADRIAVRGYGTRGSSGSPVFSADGSVVGFVSGRATDATADLVAVPVAAIRRLLDPVR